MSKFFKQPVRPGIIHILSTTNNTVMTLTDMAGNAHCTITAGALGFKNSRKSTTYAAQAIAEQIARKARSAGISSVTLCLKGLGYGKETCVRAFFKSRLVITRITERTSLAHNGCRSAKKRRV